MIFVRNLTLPKALRRCGAGLCLFSGVLTASFAFGAYANEGDAPETVSRAHVVIPQGAAAFNVSPLRIEMPTGTGNSVFQVTNSSAAPLALQARVFGWSQSGGKDRYAPDNGVAVSPAIVRIEPGATQIFRAVRRPSGDAPRSSEKSYRVILDQLPDQSRNMAGTASTLLRLSVPMFLDGDTAPASRLMWDISGGNILATNTGGQSVKISRLSLSLAGGRAIEFPGGGPRYVLAEAQMIWPLPVALSCVAAGSELVGVTDGKPYRAPLPATC